MKIPKFMKNSTHLSRQQSLARSNRQLQLTDNLYKIQPQKSVQINTNAFNAFKEIINTVPSISETAERATEFVKPQPPSIAPPPTPIQSTPLTSLFQIKASNVKSVESHLNASFVQVSSSSQGGRMATKNQPKRLQRNRGHVNSKPSNYALRSAFASQPVYQEISTSPVTRSPRTPIMPLNKASGRKIVNDKPANYEFDFVDCAKENTPVQQPVRHFERKCDSASKPTPNRVKLEQNHTPSSQMSNIAKKIQQNQTVEVQTPSSNRFSFSKLTKFVSQSAMKVMNRRSTGGGSNGSSPDTTASFSSTSMITDDEDSKIDEPEKQVEQSENFYFTCVPTEPRPEQPKPQFQQPGYSDNIYKSFEQYKEIEAKINKSSLNRMRSNASSASREQPSMGVTSIMLKNYKRSNQTSSSGNSSGMSMYQYAMTAGLGTSACLIGAPIIINSATFSKQESSMTKNMSVTSSQDSVYDHLSQKPAPFVGQTMDLKQSSNKKVVKPVVKSVASLNNQSSIPSKNLTPAKVSSFKSVSKFTQKKVEQELLYETFNDSVF
jgi:hypothetical protein